MLTSPISVTVDSTAYSCSRINQDNYSSEYFARAADNLSDLTLRVSHTLPKGQTGESHLVRADRNIYDSEGALIRTDTSWLVMKTGVTRQSTTDMAALYAGLVAALEADTNAVLLGVLGRES